MTHGEEPTSIPVEAAPDVGSERLAAALAERDVAAIGQALRHDYVVVPVTRGPGGESQIAVFGAGEGAGPGRYELSVFSSAATFAAYQAPTKEFALQLGASLAPFLEQHRTTIERVVFDPAGPHPVQADVDDVIAILQPRPTDDDVAWATAEEVAAPAAGDRAVALDLPLGKDWAVLELDRPEKLEKQVAALVRRQLRGVPSSGVLRAQLTRWLGTSARSAAGAGGRSMAFLMRRTEEAAVGLTMTMYWHELGPELGGRSHLQAITERLRAGLRTGDELSGAETAAGPFVRHTHREQGAAEVGGQGLDLLVTDYWLLFPDRRGLVLLSFSSPHPELREPLQLLADNVVLGASWVMAPQRS